MPKTSGIGQSNVTPIKQDHLRGILKTHFNVCRSIMHRQPTIVLPHYHWFDLTAGNGFDANGNPGSGMIFIQEAEAAGIPFKAVLIEINPSSCQSLKDNIQDRPGLDIVCGDHNDIFPQYFTTSTKWHVGLIYMDMNGIPSFDILTKASCVPCFQRTDILINCPATALKRNNGNIRLSEALSQIKKRYWIVRNPHGPWQWSMLIGSNWDSFPIWEKKGFYRVESAMGQKVLDVLSKTHTELKACQLNMWPTETMLNI